MLLVRTGEDSADDEDAPMDDEDDESGSDGGPAENVEDESIHSFEGHTGGHIPVMVCTTPCDHSDSGRACSGSPPITRRRGAGSGVEPRAPRRGGHGRAGRQGLPVAGEPTPYCVQPSTPPIASPQQLVGWAAAPQVGQDALESTAGSLATYELEGHTDTVASLAFSCQGNYLATGGMDGASLVLLPRL